MNASTLTLPRDLRKAVRAAVTAAPGWDAYRVATLGGRNAADMTRAEIIAAANALSVDIGAIASTLGISPNAVGTVAMSSPVAAPALPVSAPEGETPAAVTYEGRTPAAIVADAIAPVADMLSSKMLDALTAGLTPLAAAASAGPRVIRETVKETVRVDETGAIIASPVPAVRLVREDEARNVFGGLKTRAKSQSS